MKLGFRSFLKEDRKMEKIFMIFHFRKRRRNVNSSFYISIFIINLLIYIFT